MAVKWSDFALRSLEEIILYYEEQGGRALADRAEFEILGQVEALIDFPERIQESDIFPGTRRLVIDTFPYVAFLRQVEPNLWEVLDVVHTSRKLPR